MCGINGFLKRNMAAADARMALNKMNSQIVHRGPDDQGEFVDVQQDCTVAMGMQRLAIIDLSTGNQPMFSDDRSVIIVLNGEIYNYRELRNNLKDQSVVFHTESDTEVVLRLYEQYGTESFRMLDGMFGFSIYDKKIGKLFIARDFFGEKPLYYLHGDNELVWASELKSIISTMDQKPEINAVALNLYFQLTYIPAPYSIYSGIHKLEANHYLEADVRNGEIRKHLIHPKHETTPGSHLSFSDAKNKTRELVTESVMSRSVSDVSIGTFLSGGVDSSIVSLLLARDSEQKINTFSIGFEKKSFDESDKARTVARLINSNHHEFILGERDMEGSMEKILLNFDEPFADSSAIPSYLVAQQTAQYVKVALTGDGGDEVFGGYNKYYMGKINHRYTSSVPERFHKIGISALDKILTTSDDKRGKRFKARRLLQAVDYHGDFYYNIISLGFQQDELQRLFDTGYYAKDTLMHYKSQTSGKVATIKDFREIDQLLSLEGDMLVKVDRTSMLASLECRAPFLNKKIWDFTSSLPDDYLIRGWNKKYILKKTFEQDFPDGFLDKSKQGFGVPVGDWLRGILKEELRMYSDKNFLVNQGIFNPEYIVPMVKNHLDGVADNTFRIWTFYCFQKWYQNIYKQ